METHLRHHDLERLSRPAPRLCRNANCGRTQDGANKLGDTRAGTRKGQGPGAVGEGDLQLLARLRRPAVLRALVRVDARPRGQGAAAPHRAALSQSAAHRVWAAVVQERILPHRQEEPRSGRSVGAHARSDSYSEAVPGGVLAEMLTAEKGVEGKGGYGLEWCVAALEAENGDLDKARSWLKGWAPQRTEA